MNKQVFNDLRGVLAALLLLPVFAVAGGLTGGGGASTGTVTFSGSSIMGASDLLSLYPESESDTTYCTLLDDGPGGADDAVHCQSEEGAADAEWTLYGSSYFVRAGTNQVDVDSVSGTTVTGPLVLASDDVQISEGGTGASTATAAFDALAPTTTQGDIIYFNGTDNVRLAKGTASQVLAMNSGATAPEWVASPAGTFSALQADFTNATTTPTTVTDGAAQTWSFAVEANTAYTLVCEMWLDSSSSAEGQTWVVDGPASPAVVAGGLVIGNDATPAVLNTITGDFSGDISLVATVTATNSGAGRLTVYWNNGANAGNLLVQMRTETSATQTVEAGSWCEFKRR